MARVEVHEERNGVPILPDVFNDDGLLPPGDYQLTLDQLRTSMLAVGPADRSATWDEPWRAQLVENLAKLVGQLRQLGPRIGRIFINGSFVEAKDHPNDIDGYFECDLMFLATGELERALNDLDPHGVWTWDSARRRRYPDSTKAQLPMWHVYRVELYPHVGQLTGIVDQFGNELQFPSAFRLARGSYRQKGIVEIVS